MRAHQLPPDMTDAVEKSKACQRRARAGRICGTGRCGMFGGAIVRFPESLRLGPRELDYLAPFLDFFCDEPSESGGAARNYGRAPLRQPGPLVVIGPSPHRLPL